MMPIFNILVHLLDPFIFLAYTATYIPRTIIILVTSGQSSALLSPARFKNAWFAIFWKDFGPVNTERARQNVEPLMNLATGVVLDIGPGNGEWLRYFDKEKVTKIYGVEPNRDHHPLLLQRIKAAGLSDIYTIVPVGVEDLNGIGLYGGEKTEEGWVQKAECDFIVTIHCLCSVPQPREMILGLYPYLKVGGSWLVYEHVKTKTGGLIRAYQSMLDIVWPHFVGGCSITRDTEAWLRDAGSWAKVDLKQPETEPSYQILPQLLGVLTK